jgi:hypothetical protein
MSLMGQSRRFRAVSKRSGLPPQCRHVGIGRVRQRRAMNDRSGSSDMTLAGPISAFQFYLTLVLPDGRLCTFALPADHEPSCDLALPFDIDRPTTIEFKLLLNALICPR